MDVPMPHKDHNFGGDWTERKLDVLAEYLEAYQIALKSQPFTCTYIDAFAGSGVRGTAVVPEEGPLRQTFFAKFEGEEPQGFRAGSARRALEISQPFDRYLFVENDPAKCQELMVLQGDYPNLAKSIRVIRGDANEVIQKLCRKNWSHQRAVLFLDPYGLQVEWATIEAVAKTQAIDMWLLFPLGSGVGRMLPRSGEIPPSWRERLDALLGTTDWYDAFYRPISTQQTLFGENEIVKAKSSYDVISRYFVDRLKTVFPAVSENPGVLMNSKNCPLYLLCFAAANEKGGSIACRIANHLLKEIS
jgi:three-Cys-motif partner protein